MGTGRGGESVFSKLYGDQAKFFEMEKVPRIKHKKIGTVSMVNNGSEQHGSQFLITTGENLDYLDQVHTVFGEVTEGMDIVKKINEAFVDKDFVPYQDIRINHTVILDDPYDDPPELPIPDRSPEPTREQLDSGRIGADEDINDTKGKSVEEVEELLAEKEAKTQAVLLEMVGDIPDADIKPPENVLFVCKLNPVTTDEDLEIIFSRFGTIQSCEIIRDFKSGDSLCYAFIEFEKEEDCEKAYFKMDNVLIDDRRIHVDFSQSVSKVKWKGKGGKYTKEDFKEYEKEADKHSKLALKDKVKPKEDKYDLVLDEDMEESISSSNQRHKKHKKDKKHHYSDEEDERKMKRTLRRTSATGDTRKTTVERREGARRKSPGKAAAVQENVAAITAPNRSTERNQGRESERERETGAQINTRSGLNTERETKPRTKCFDKPPLTMNILVDMYQNVIICSKTHSNNLYQFELVTCKYE
ncbi:peptidyl-prolyl cis-trans isomerase-like 4 isoform X2 [Ascaphus truei]|uniref:peptidyl-prolyl cis-trans isomerase-like 4 isoform X2 n=1 Tax=Ascaphus truei TaxID=8439 RepID=UPI003F593737